MEGYINENRWIDLSGLPRFNGTSRLIHWEQCVGYDVSFQYDHVFGTIHILHYKRDQKSKKTTLTICIDNYTPNPINVHTDFFIHCRLSCLVENRIADLRPDLIPYLANKEDAYLYAISSEREVNVMCPTCGYKRKVRVINLRKYGFVCHCCGDGVSYPEKFILNMLSQLKVNYIKEVSKKNYGFEWAKKYRYDFVLYLDNKKYIIEADGGFHRYTDQKCRDKNKTLLAERHGFEVIRINCNYCDCNRFDFIRNNILSSKLSIILPLNNVDWDKCNSAGVNSITQQTWDLWEKSEYSLQQISDTLKISRATLYKYLTLGRTLGFCPSYTTEEASLRGRTKPVAYFIDNKVVNVFCNSDEVVKYFKDVYDIKLEIYEVRLICRGLSNKCNEFHFEYITREKYLQHKMIENNIEVVKGGNI